MGSLLIVVVMTFTVAGAVVLGVTLAYTSVLVLLHAVAVRKQPAAKPALVLVHSQSQAGGD